MKEKESTGQDKKRLLYKVIIGILITTGILGLLVVRKLYINRENLLMAYEKELIPGIVCYGDSLTYGSGGEGVSYPSVLEECLRKNRIYIPVVNMGIGGENTVTIAGRAGAIPFRVAEFEIPTEAIPTEITFLEEKGKSIRPLYQGDTGINPCFIEGVKGCITGEKDEQGAMVYFFTRSEGGEATKVPEGSEVETWASTQFQDYIYVVFMGENHGWNDDINELIRQQQEILSMQEKHKGKYIVVGLPTGTAEERTELEAALSETYGDKFFNIREYMSTEALEDAGIKPTDEDVARMAEGMVPTSLLVDHIHFNAKGYRLLGEQVYERMQELGYFDELEDVVEEYGSSF